MCCGLILRQRIVEVIGHSFAGQEWPEARPMLVAHRASGDQPASVLGAADHRCLADLLRRVAAGLPQKRSAPHHPTGPVAFRTFGHGLMNRTVNTLPETRAVAVD